MSREEILSAISELSVLELSDLINDMEEKFGVSAAAAVAVAAPAAAAADAGHGRSCARRRRGQGRRRWREGRD